MTRPSFFRASMYACVGALLLLSGCSTRGSSPSASSGKKSAWSWDKPSPLNARPHPHYKVGKPYNVMGTIYYPEESFSYSEEGIASWYGPGFHARLTANGERYDSNKATAAHRTLQMPSIVKVTNLENGKSTYVRVNDRGPYHKSRVIDVSKRAAQELGFINKGTAKVRVEILGDISRRLATLARQKKFPQYLPGHGITEDNLALPFIRLSRKPDHIRSFMLNHLSP